MHIIAPHHHLFQDVFAWAGRPRTVRISKGGSTFCYPEHIDEQMKRLFETLRAAGLLFGLPAHAFALRAAHLLAELNAIHCFREGNGRTQLTFFTLLATRAGHPPNLERMQPDGMLRAMIASFDGDEAPLAALIKTLIEP